jgi:hypothetical protein
MLTTFSGSVVDKGQLCSQALRLSEATLLWCSSGKLCVFVWQALNIEQAPKRHGRGRPPQNQYDHRKKNSSTPRPRDFAQLALHLI